MVLRIAVVDDEITLLNDIKTFVHKYLALNKIVSTIDIFLEHKLLLYELEDKTYYDLFLLDIQTKNDDLNGVETAKKIKELNNNAYVIFVTSYMRYTLDAFKVNAFRYITKNNIESGLSEALDEIIKKQNKNKENFYVIETVTSYIKIYHNDICYIYKNGKYSVFVSKIGEYKVRKSLAVVHKELNSSEFIFIERGYIANISRIERLEDEQIYLDTKDVLKVSRPQLHFVKEKMTEYWGTQV